MQANSGTAEFGKKPGSPGWRNSKGWDTLEGKTDTCGYLASLHRKGVGRYYVINPRMITEQESYVYNTGKKERFVTGYVSSDQVRIMNSQASWATSTLNLEVEKADTDWEKEREGRETVPRRWNDNEHMVSPPPKASIDKEIPIWQH